MTLTRRDAILISLGRGDQVALERERQSAIDAARGYVTEEPAVSPEPARDAPSALGSALTRLRGIRRRLFR